MAYGLIRIVAVLFALTSIACGQAVEDVVIHPKRHVDSLNIHNKERVDCSDIASRNPFVILAAGQSLVANSNGDLPWQRVSPQNVYEHWEGACYKANAPLYGASDGRQSFVIPLADLIARATGRDVLINMAAIGSTPAGGFIEGVGADLLSRQISNAKAVGFSPSIVIWEHGQANRLDPKGTYSEVVGKLVENLRSKGVAAPIFVSTDSFFEWKTFKTLKAEQSRIWEIEGVEPGPNIDLIRFRSDGTHLDQYGVNVQAAMWFQVLAEYFDW